MTLYIGVDIHARQQTLSFLDTEDGTTGQVELQHERDDVRLLEKHAIAPSAVKR